MNGMKARSRQRRVAGGLEVEQVLSLLWLKARVPGCWRVLHFISHQRLRQVSYLCPSLQKYVRDDRSSLWQVLDHWQTLKKENGRIDPRSMP